MGDLLRACHPLILYLLLPASPAHGGPWQNAITTPRGVKKGVVLLRWRDAGRRAYQHRASSARYPRSITAVISPTFVKHRRRHSAFIACGATAYARQEGAKEGREGGATPSHLRAALAPRAVHGQKPPGRVKPARPLSTLEGHGAHHCSPRLAGALRVARLL